MKSYRNNNNNNNDNRNNSNNDDNNNDDNNDNKNNNTNNNTKPGRFTLFLNNTNTNAILLSIGTIQYNAISFSIDCNSSQYKNVYRILQGYVWIVITIMKKMYMIYKMHKETFCFVRLLGNSLILIHTIYWRNCFGRKNHGGGGRIVVCGLRNCSLCTQ